MAKLLQRFRQLQRLLDPTRFEIEILADETLAGEVLDQIAEKNPPLICLASLPPGGLGETRYLCKRLRARFPEIKILVGCWGNQSDKTSSVLLAAGADKVAITMIETRDQIIQASQMISAN